MIRYALVLPVILLAACGSKTDEASTANGADVIAAKVEEATKGGNFVSPGRWEGTVRITDVNIPGMNPSGRAKVQAQMAKVNSFANCLTPEEAKQPRGKFFGADQGGTCTYDSFAMANGAIDAVMSCGTGAQARKMVMKGSYSPQSYDMQVVSTPKTGGESGLSMTMAMQARNTGACVGSEGSDGK